jgi:hypothetical protein
MNKNTNSDDDEYTNDHIFNEKIEELTNDNYLNNYRLQILSISTVYPCQNCDHTFDFMPLGCPIDIINKKELYKDLILKNHVQKLNLLTNIKYYFRSVGIFCSLNCIKRFILQQEQNNVMFLGSLDLLSFIKNKVFGKNTPIKKAKSIKKLEKFGGNTKIEEYRHEFDVIDLRENSVNPIKKRICFITKT